LHIKRFNNCDEIPEITLPIIKDTLCFDFPLIEVEKVFFLLNYFMVQQWHSRMLAHDSCHVVWGISIKISKTVKYGSCCYWAIQAALLQAVSWRKGVEVIILYPSGKVRYSGTPIDYIGTKYKSTEWMAF
jgi:threonine synthase